MQRVSAADAYQYLHKIQFFRLVYYLGLAAVIIGFFYSRAILSIGQIAIACNWLLEGDLRNKFKTFFRSKVAILLVAVYVMHVAGLLYTTDFGYAFKDLRVKLPLLLFPIVFSTTNILSGRRFRQLCMFFILVLFSSTMVSLFFYLMNRDHISDMRVVSLFISHIRFSLASCLAIVIGLYYFFEMRGVVRGLLLFFCAWILTFLLFAESMTGLFILLALMPFLLFKLYKSSFVKRRQLGIALTAVGLVFIMLCWSAVAVVSDYYENAEVKSTPDLTVTAAGGKYHQGHENKHYKMRENGHFVFQNICYAELKEAWNARSQLKINPTDVKFNNTQHVLIRFLTSKGLPKDAASVNSLTEEEVNAIENGVTNVNYIGKPGIYVRLQKLLWEIDNYKSEGDFNGHSLAMRLEFWKTGWHVFLKHPLFGTGTGDIDMAFQKQYDEDQSLLRKEWRFRAHNQWITIGATFGIFGLLLFIYAVLLPVLRKRNSYFYMSFAIIFICSFFTEDTLDTQIGVTFYAFFNSLLFFQEAKSDKI